MSGPNHAHRLHQGRQNGLGSSLLVVVFLLTAVTTGGDAPCRAAADGGTGDVVGSTQGGPDTVRFSNPVWSPDGRHLALSDDHHNGVYVLDTHAHTCVQITDAPSSGYTTGNAWVSSC